jgi:hypothetical protein
MKIRVLNQKTGSFKNKINFKSEKSLGTLRTALITVGVFDGAISNTRPPRDQTLYGLVLVIRK